MFEPSPLTANANLQLDIEPEVKDSCKCWCCIPFKAVKKNLTPRRRIRSVEIRAEIIKTEVLDTK